MSAAASDTIATIRRFNRFYTRAMGVLDRAFLGGPYTLTESRVLHELAHAEDVTPKAIATALDLDAGYLSRMLARLQRDGLVARRPSSRDGRSIVLNLTEAGRTHFAGLDARMIARIEELTAGLSAADHATLAASLSAAQALLEAPPPVASEPAPIVLRAHQAGDMGWVVERNARIYGEEYGWGAKIESVTARIVADFLDSADPAKSRCWIAARGDERLGSVFLVDDGEGVARLRLLMLEPAARGYGLGRRLVDECIGFAREAGYREVVLWTHAVLTQARRIYAAAGFKLETSWTHEEFGGEVVSETWRLKL